MSNLPDLSKSSPLTFKREEPEPARPTKVGGEVASFPLRHPFRFHACRFPNVSALRFFPPPPPLRSLTCGPDPGNERRRPRTFPQGSTGKRGPGGGGRAVVGAGEGGGGTLPPSGPRREAPNLYQRPLAHTNPDVAVSASRRHVRRDPASGPPLAFVRSGAYQAPAERGILGVVVLGPQPPCPGGGRGDGAGRREVTPRLGKVG